MYAPWEPVILIYYDVYTLYILYVLERCWHVGCSTPCLFFSRLKELCPPLFIRAFLSRTLWMGRRIMCKVHQVYHINMPSKRLQLMNQTLNLERWVDFTQQIRCTVPAMVAWRLVVRANAVCVGGEMPRTIGVAWLFLRYAAWPVWQCACFVCNMLKKSEDINDAFIHHGVENWAVVHCIQFFQPQIAQVLLPWWHPSLRTTLPMPMCSLWCNSSTGRWRPSRWCTIWTSQSVTPWQWQTWWLWKRPPKQQAQVQPPWHLHWRSVGLLHSWEFKRCWDLQSWVSIFLLARSLLLCSCEICSEHLNYIEIYSGEMFVAWVRQEHLQPCKQMIGDVITSGYCCQAIVNAFKCMRHYKCTRRHVFVIVPIHAYIFAFRFIKILHSIKACDVTVYYTRVCAYLCVYYTLHMLRRYLRSVFICMYSYLYAQAAARQEKTDTDNSCRSSQVIKQYQTRENARHSNNQFEKKKQYRISHRRLAPTYATDLCVR